MAQPPHGHQYGDTYGQPAHQAPQPPPYDNARPQQPRKAKSSGSHRLLFWIVVLILAMAIIGVAMQESREKQNTSSAGAPAAVVLADGSHTARSQ